MAERERAADHATEERAVTRETERALTARERLNRELDALEASLRAMRGTVVEPDAPREHEAGR